MRALPPSANADLLARVKPRLPLLVAAAFAIYAFVLLGNTVQSQAQLRAAADARLVADNRRRAAALGEYAAARRLAAEDLAALHEVHSYLANRALGMSPRYGLDASVGAVEARFRQAAGQDTVGTTRPLTRAIFIDATGTVVVDTGGEPQSAPLPAPRPDLPRLALDLPLHTLVATAPVVFKGVYSGTVVTLSEVGRLHGQLMQTDAGDGYRETLFTRDGQELTPPGRTPVWSPALAAALSQLPADQPAPLPADAGAGDGLAVLTPVPGLPAMLVTTLPRSAAYGHLSTQGFLAALGVFPLLVLLAALLLRRLQGRNEHLSAEIVRRDVATAELQRYGSQLEMLINRRTAELNRLFHALPDLYFRIARDGTILEHRAGREAELLIPAERFIGRRMQDVLPASVGRQIDAAIAELAAGAEQATVEYELDAASGRRYFEARVLPLGGEECVVVVRNVTERREIEDVREANRREAERLVRVKSEFLANMSHEIRTPLNAVLGLAQIGARNPDGALAGGARGSFLRIEEAGRHLLGIIDDILDLSKLEAGKLAVERRPFKLAAMVDAALGLVAGRTAAKGLALRATLAQDLPEWVEGDALRLKQVLVNLLANAVKFTSRGEVVLSVARAGERIAFVVRDTGIGMDAAQLARVFLPFEQADGSTSRRFGGTGLGLAISRNLAGLMGGSIEATSTPCEGSSFTLTVPLPRAEAQAPPRAAAAVGNRLAGLNLLAAEDLEVNRIVLEGQLAFEGARVVFAEDGRQAVAAVAQAPPGSFDAVLMDVQMPVMDGLAAARELARIAPALPVIGLTAHALAEERDRCLQAGMVEHVVKPVDLDLLVAAVLRHARPAAMPPAVAEPEPAQAGATAVV